MDVFQRRRPSSRRFSSSLRPRIPFDLRYVAEALEPRRLLCGMLLDAMGAPTELAAAVAAAASDVIPINFQPASAQAPAGYHVDSGAVFGDRGNGHSYGWNINLSTATRDRNSVISPDQRYDTLVHTQMFGNGVWELAVPNGTYKVHLVAGDGSFTNSVYKFNVEGTLALSGTPDSGSHWIENTINVTVSDGRLTVSNAAGASNNKLAFLDVTPVGAQPSSVPTIPGTVQAEDFDNGGAGVSFFDTTPGNSGGQYRSTDVDIIAASEGGFAVGFIKPSEWLKYTLDVKSSGNYTLDVRTASASAGGTFHIEIDGVNKTGAMTLAGTGGWQTWKTITKTGVNVTAGKHVLRLVFDSAASSQDIGNVNWIKFTGPVSTTPTLSIAATDDTASETAGNTATFTVTRTGSTSASLNVNYTVGGTATNSSDYNTLSGVVTIPAGSASAKIVVTPKVDGLVEPTETVKLTLSGTSGYTLDNSSATAFITDANSSTGTWPAGWRSGASAPKQRWESGSVAMDGKIWVFGGWVSGSQYGTQQVDVYDVASNTWTTLPEKAPIPQTHAALAADPVNHVIYFAGGLYGNYPGTSTDGVWKFDTLTKTWSTLPSMPTTRNSGCLALVNNELHYIGGSQADRVTNDPRHYVLNLNNLAAGWTSAPDMPDARDHFAHVVLNGKIFCIGGEFGHDIYHIQQSLVDAYDPIAKTWTRMASMNVRRSHIESSTFVWNGKIICAGGQVDNYASTDDVESYDPVSNQWTTIGMLPAKLQGPIVQRVGNQIIVATGNKGDLVPLTTVWIGDL